MRVLSCPVIPQICFGKTFYWLIYRRMCPCMNGIKLAIEIFYIPFVFEQQIFIKMNGISSFPPYPILIRNNCALAIDIVSFFAKHRLKMAWTLASLSSCGLNWLLNSSKAFVIFAVRPTTQAPYHTRTAQKFRQAHYTDCRPKRQGRGGIFRPSLSKSLPPSSRLGQGPAPPGRLSPNFFWKAGTNGIYLCRKWM